MHVPATPTQSLKSKTTRPDTFLDFATAKSLIMRVESVRNFPFQQRIQRTLTTKKHNTNTNKHNKIATR